MIDKTGSAKMKGPIKERNDPSSSSGERQVEDVKENVSNPEKMLGARKKEKIQGDFFERRSLSLKAGNKDEACSAEGKEKDVAPPVVKQANPKPAAQKRVIHEPVTWEKMQEFMEFYRDI